MVWRKIPNFAPPIKNKTDMNRQQILSAIANLAASQGFYGRLYDMLTNGSDEAEEALCMMEEQNFGDAVDMVMWLEC